MRHTATDARHTAEQDRPHVTDSLMRGMRRAMMCLIVLAIAFLACWFYAQHQVHEEIRRYFESKLASHYADRGILVNVRSARLIEGQGIEIRDVILVDRQAGPADPPLAQVDELFVACHARLQDLISRPPAVEHVTIRRLTLRASREMSGHWNVERLLPLPRFSDRPPPVAIENATVELAYFDAQRGKPVRLRAIHATLTPRNADASLAPTASVGELSSSSNQPSVDVSGTFSGDHLEQARFEGSVDPATGHWTVEGSAENIRVSPQLIHALQLERMEYPHFLASLRGNLGLTYSISRASHSDASPALRFTIDGKLTDGALEDPRLPYPITDIVADVHCNERGLRVENATARSGLGQLELSCRREGFHDTSPLKLTANAKQLVLNERLADVLPTEMRGLWDKLSPAGTVNLDVSLSFDGMAWQPIVTVDCLDVSFAYHLFPYRLRGCLGAIHWSKQLCTLDVRALVSGRVARLQGEFQNPGPHFTGWLDVTLDGPVTVNDEILSSLQSKPQRIVRAFHPRGMFTLRGRFTRRDPHQKRLDEQLTIEVLDGAIKHERFPYPIERIRGVVEMVNGQWEFRGLEGYNDSGYIHCNGRLMRQADHREELELTFTGSSIPLEDELREALNPNAQKIWSQLRPRGTVDRLEIALRHSSGWDKPSLEIRAEKRLKDAQDVEGRSLTVHPAWFPYRMDDLTGQVRWANGEVVLEDLMARHGNTRWTMNGECVFIEGAWRVSLKKLTASRLRADRELTSALPARLGRAMSALNFNGLVTLEGSLAFFGSADPSQPVRANWDLALDIEDGDIACGIQLRDLRGTVYLSGDAGEHGLRSRGNLKFDSLIYDDIQFTEVRGPLSIDDFRVAFGRPAHPLGTIGQPTPLSAKVFGGRLQGDAVVLVTEDSRFDLNALLQGADLVQLAREVAPGKTKITGRADAQINLSGNDQGTHMLRGGGWVRLYDADIYEVPVMLALLKILSVRRPNTTAFDTSQMEFRIHGSHIYLDRIDFSGDAISLRGNGEIGLDRTINLYFYTIVGRNEFLVPFVSPILGLASREFLRIHVGGTLDQPNPPVREVLPGLNETLRQLFPEIDGRQSGDRQSLRRGQSASEQRRLFWPP